MATYHVMSDPVISRIYPNHIWAMITTCSLVKCNFLVTVPTCKHGVLENSPFIDDFPIKTAFIYRGCRIAIFDYGWYFHEFGMLERPNPPLGPRCPFCLSKLTTSSIITFPHIPKMDKEAIATQKKSNRQNKNQILVVNWCKLNLLYPFEGY